MSFCVFHEDGNKFTKWLDNRKKMLQKGHQDTVMVICGGEQLGKSRFALRLDWYLFKDKFYKDGKFDLSNIVFTGSQYRKRIFDIEKSILHDDEAVTHFYSRDANTWETKNCNKALKLCGYKHNFQLLLIPSYFDIDTYIRKHRVHAIVKIYPGNKFKVWNFTKSKKKLEYILKYSKFTKCSSRGWWTEKDTDEEFEQFVKQYRKRENKYKKAAGQDKQKDQEKPEYMTVKDVQKRTAYDMYKKGMTQQQIADIFDTSRVTINAWCKEFVKVVKP